MREEPLPYFNERETPIDMIVLHCSAYDVETIIHYMHEYQLSAHYIIDEKGEMTKLVDESKRAYHAGTGFWRGEDRSPNARSIGIELVNFSLGQETYAPQQIDTLLNFLLPLIGKYNIRPEMIVGHSDIAPLRKADPGRAFPWERLANAGIGLWYQLSNAEKIPSDDLEELLRLIGYDTRTPQTVYASAYAFCRRFAPQFIAADPDIKHLVDHILPENFDFIDNAKFRQTLKAVAYTYSGNQESNPLY